MCRLFNGQELEQLDFWPNNDRLTSIFYTFEGRKRCGDCGQLWSMNQHSCQSILPNFVGSLCDSCGMPFPGGRAGYMRKRRHDDRCRGEQVRAGWQPASDGTLHCPLCKTPGFNWQLLDEHLTKEGEACDGNRKPERWDKEEQEVLVGRGWKIFCQGCEYTFQARHSFARHVCGSPHDPIWLGDTTHPNTSKPYVVWCHEDASPDIPVGYGGGQIAGDEDAAIPDAVRDASWGIPFSTHAEPRPDGVAQFLEDVRFLIRLVRRRLLREAGGVLDKDAENGDGDGDDDGDDDDDDDDDEGGDEGTIGIPENDMSLISDGLNVRKPPTISPNHADARE